MPWSGTRLLGKGRLRKFRLRYETTKRKSQGLDITRARALCPIIAKILYANLEELYTTFQYLPSDIWNCDGSRVQVGRSGGATVLAKQGSKSM